jgi:hypothetical protein
MFIQTPVTMPFGKGMLPPDHPPGWNNLSEKEKRKYEKKPKKPKSKAKK